MGSSGGGGEDSSSAALGVTSDCSSSPAGVVEFPLGKALEAADSVAVSELVDADSEVNGGVSVGDGVESPGVTVGVGVGSLTVGDSAGVLFGVELGDSTKGDSTALDDEDTTSCAKTPAQKASKAMLLIRMLLSSGIFF